MSTTATEPTLAGFLATVRAELADLNAEELAEITDGLEADLAELVAERGVGALGDPVAYARELRSAAGLEPVARRRRRERRPTRESLTELLDLGQQRYDELVERVEATTGRDPRPLLAWLRPAWWVLRAWVAVQVLGLFFGSSYGSTVLPVWNGLGLVLLIAAIAISVQIGRGRLWPGDRQTVGPRVLLLGLNVFAMMMVIPAIADIGNRDWSTYDRGWMAGYEERGYEMSGGAPIDEQAGVYSGGRWVSNIHPYDAAGQPLVGVQLFDQDGNPIDVVTRPDCEVRPGETRPEVPFDEDQYVESFCENEGYDRVFPKVSYPWTNGAAQLFNVFPLTSRVQEQPQPTATAFAEADPPAIGVPPLASVPPASLPGIAPSVQQTEPAVPGEIVPEEIAPEGAAEEGTVEEGPRRKKGARAGHGD